MRQRINRAAICSSDNYAASKRLHREYLKNTHEDRVANIAMMSVTTSVTNHIGRPYTNIFGHKVYLNASEASMANEAGITVHYEQIPI